MLVVLDGFGIRAETAGNAIALGRMPTWQRLLRDYPSTYLETSGEAVGLPAGQMGNSEVGHLNLGAGRIVYQELTRIDLSIRKGDFFLNPALVGACRSVKQSGGALHLMGLCSDGGVHSSLEHLYALLQLAKHESLERVFVHAFTDGRDTPPKSGEGYVRAIEAKTTELGIGRVATVCGRYFAMDRDNRWDRVERAYRLLRDGSGVAALASTASGVVAEAYAAGETDEFIAPRAVAGLDARVKDGDGVIFFNFRPDRAREISRAFIAPTFDGFARGAAPALASYTCLTQYDASFALPVAYPPRPLDGLLCNLLAARGAPELRIAETEKYAHITYFFNGGVEAPVRGEERVLIPSPKDVATYDLKPEMSAPLVTERLAAEIASRRFQFHLVNYANADMVGHTGNLAAAIKAVETIDLGLLRITDAMRAIGGFTLITADHGNVEMMIDPVSGGPHTAHTLNPVPFVLVDDERRGVAMHNGILADVAPTLLALWGVEKTPQMEGRSLVVGS